LSFTLSGPNETIQQEVVLPFSQPTIGLMWSRINAFGEQARVTGSRDLERTDEIELWRGEVDGFTIIAHYSAEVNGIAIIPEPSSGSMAIWLLPVLFLRRRMRRIR
jgi:hypothetical protein